MSDYTTPAALLRLQNLRPMTPEEAERRRVEDDARRAERHRYAVEELRRDWNAPRRHTDARSLDRSGQWGATLERLNGRLGSGFLVALLGGRGTGKTQLAVELMRETTQRLKGARYASAMEFFMELKATYRKDSKATEADVLAHYRRPALLVLDEIGRRGESDWENNLLFELLDKRYADARDTVLLSNHDRAGLLAALGPSLTSRMQETGGVVECGWGGWRV